jgi:hypothetical protein
MCKAENSLTTETDLINVAAAGILDGHGDRLSMSRWGDQLVESSVNDSKISA